MNKKLRRHSSLKTWRLSHGMSQQEAAEILGISVGFYERVENRKNFFRGPKAAEVRDKTGVSVEVLVGAA